MATKTEESIKALAIELAVVTTQLKMGVRNLELVHELSNQVAVLQTQMTKLIQADVTTQVAILQAQLAELAKTKELWGQRGWAVLTVCLSAGFSFLAVVLGSLLTFYINAKR